MEDKDSRRSDEEPTRDDDRNEELDQSPVPDPEAKETGAEDDPQAD